MAAELEPRAQMTAADLLAALDDLPLVRLQLMEREVLTRIREYENRISTPGTVGALMDRRLLDDYNERRRIIQDEVLDRTARFADRAGLAWTAEDDARLQRLARAGETIECIASALGRSTPSISMRGSKLGITFGNDGCADGRSPEPRAELQRDAAFAATVRGAL